MVDKKQTRTLTSNQKKTNLFSRLELEVKAIP
jgi:hypothetical protein